MCLGLERRRVRGCGATGKQAPAAAITGHILCREPCCGDHREAARRGSVEHVYGGPAAQARWPVSSEWASDRTLSPRAVPSGAAVLTSAHLAGRRHG